MPDGMAAKLNLPAVGRYQVLLNGRSIAPKQRGKRLVLPGSHTSTIEVLVG